ncbi:MAG: Hsp20/alpha crystallin family protein [bacterium]|nr:MAG: Hsp20/alpha crystallin family protein [bacterium]
MKKFWDASGDAIWVRTIRSSFLRHYLTRGMVPGSETQETSDPAIDVRETDAELVIEGEMPGVDREDFHLTLDGGLLIIEGYKREPKYGHCQDFHRMERQFGFFRRIIDLPATVKTSGTKADLIDGVLIIRLPKVQDRRKGRVKIPVSG